MSCVFCTIPNSAYIAENESFYAIADIHPVSPGHTLIIPKRHYEDVFTMEPDEAPALQKLIMMVKEWLDDRYSPDGYNLAVNCGRHAGQKVFHFHLHVIPRFRSSRPNIRREYIAETE